MRFPINHFMAECENAFFFAVKHYNFPHETGPINSMRAGSFRRASWDCFNILSERDRTSKLLTERFLQILDIAADHIGGSVEFCLFLLCQRDLDNLLDAAASDDGRHAAKNAVLDRKSVV